MKPEIIHIGGGGYCKLVIEAIEQEDSLVNVPSGIISTDLLK